MTQQELSTLLGIDPNNLAGYEAGEKRINANLLLRIAKLLDVRPDYFFRGYKEEEDWKTL
jgi:transcriptional regulator with XRE-family HTH domain